jgi:hypothetical protein
MAAVRPHELALSFTPKFRWAIWAYKKRIVEFVRFLVPVQNSISGQD